MPSDPRPGPAPVEAATLRGQERWKVVVEDSAPHGDVYELDIDTYHYVVDRRSDVVVLSFLGTGSSRLDDHGCWGPARSSGVDGVEISEDGREVIVKDASGTERRVRLPPDEEPSP